jgi:conjugal transfer pilus assembly protein TraU
MLFTSNAQAACHGKMTNPVTDVCWSCIFPISVGGFTVIDGTEEYDTKNPSNPVCACGSPIPRVGIRVGFWEPVRMVDVVREPFCFVNLGGIKIDPGAGFTTAARGSQSYDDSQTRSSNYQVHWYEYPALVWLELITFVTCLEKGDFDLAMMSEFDPGWDDDIASLVISPEAALFGNPIAQGACAADCAAASSGKLPLDALFWCAGCHGSMYPLNGSIGNQTSAIQGSSLLVERMTFKLHREGLLWGTMGEAGVCQSYPMPIMDKSQYKSQLTYPMTAFNKGDVMACNPYGRTTVLWESGKSMPYKGEDFGYLIWRKRNCCAF